MKYPKPVLIDGRWEVDLRAWGYGWHYRLGPAEIGELEAGHRAWAKLFELQSAAATAPPGPQLAFVAPGTAPATLAGAIDAWEPTKRYKDKPGSKKYGKQYAKAVRSEIGSVPLRTFCQPGGEQLLRDYVRDLEAGAHNHVAYSGRSIRNRLSIVSQVLRFCVGDERGWLPYVPAMPEAPPKAPPKFDWISEQTFRWVRDRIYSEASMKHLASVLRREELGSDPKLYVARRKLYLSWLFYTGVRTHDADDWTANDVGLDVGVYIRHGRKTGIPLEQFEMPTPLMDDLREYLSVVGREFFLDGELIGGGPWSTVARVLTETAEELKLGFLNPRKLRRSYARRMFELGYTVKEVADRMGHVDLRMLHEIYVRTPRAAGRARTLWPRFGVTPTHGPTGTPRKIVAFPSAQDLKKGK